MASVSQWLFFWTSCLRLPWFSLSLSNCLVIPCHPHPECAHQQSRERRVSRTEPTPPSSEGWGGVREDEETAEEHSSRAKRLLQTERSKVVGGGPSLNWGRKKGGSRGRQELKQREPTILYYYEFHGNQILKERHKPHQVFGNLETAERNYISIFLLSFFLL